MIPRLGLARPGSTAALLLALVFVAGTAPSTFADAPAGYSLLDPARHGAYLRLGAQGPAVAALQRALSAAGYPVATTALFDAATLGAVRRFQQDSGCTVDGIVGAQTLAALDVALGLGSPAPPPSGTPAGAIPSRSLFAEGGTSFIHRTWNLSRPQREQAILQAFLGGNLPNFERWFANVTVTATLSDGWSHTATYRVLPDYLAVGSDVDFVRMPMNPLTAQRIADAFGCSLPTRRMVNDIYRQASVRLAPIPMTPGPQMMSNDYILTHQRRVEGARAGRPLGVLTGGHKKDVVLSNLLRNQPGRVAIYGWHMLNGQPIQPLSTVHENTYADYSHGIRLVDRTLLVDGQPMSITDVLRHPVLSRLLSDEGPMPQPRIPGVTAP
ncbi:MAG: peptidoglycan-binding protein [Planctomycetes bacterium]|nr:peptidoglycan-binding protein [Planctomycetota bacterium]